jgi:DNA-binding LacI/PurR family transcriptional regulator/DNA-binding transcriptional regulator YhcF (GntR family)
MGLTCLTAADRVYQHLRTAVQGGTYAAQARLPSLRELARRHGTTVADAQRAVARLRHDGLVEARHGSGTYVRELPARLRRLLFLTRMDGEEWGACTQAVVEAFGRDPHARLTVESVPPDLQEEGRPADELTARLRCLVGEGIDLVILNGMANLPLEVVRACAARVPLVAYYWARNDVAPLVTGQVVSDWHVGGRAGLRHLLATGCRELVVTRHSAAPLGPLVPWLAGIAEALAETPTPIRVHPFIASVAEAPQAVRERFRQLLREHPAIDGIYAHADWLAAQLLFVATRQGRRIPDDLRVLGYYDTAWVRYTDPPLSSFSHCHAAMAEALVQWCQAPRPGRRIVVPPALIERESTLPPTPTARSTP